MWKLCPADETGGGPLYRLLVGVEYVVGRKNCGILIQNDPSISRSHAVLSVNHPQVNLSQFSSFPELTLKDTSKYGTFVNGENLQKGNTITLNTGDRITFGVSESKYRVEYEPLVVCSSCLDVSQKNILNKNILQLGGHVVNEWNEECTHLVMVLVKVTVKTICALICGRPIMKPEYFDELIKAIQAKQTLPLPERFFPRIGEPSIESENIDLTKCPRRRTIFRGKLFMFLTAKQHAKLSSAIKLGGGEARLLTDKTEDTAVLITSNTCVIEVGSTNSQPSLSILDKKWIDNITAALQRKNYRTISEAEIGLAVIFASTEKYCNPQISPSGDIKTATLASQLSQSQSVAVEETTMPSNQEDISAFVADTEMDEVMDTLLMELSQDEKKPVTQSQDIMTVRETPEGTGSVNRERILPQLKKTHGADFASLACLSSEISSHSRNREEDSQQLNSIKNYFQTTVKKRERNEELETPLSKHAKMDKKSSQVSHQTPSVPFLLRENNVDSQKGQRAATQGVSDSNLDSRKSSIVENNKLKQTGMKSILLEMPASKKRKKIEDPVEDEASLELVFASQELDLEENIGEQDAKNTQNAKKKVKLDLKETTLRNTETKIEATRFLGKNEESLPAETQKEEIKEEPPEPNPGKCGDVSSYLPNKLLLMEFRSLVVTQPRKISPQANSDYGHLSNFKKFKKIAYPGAGRLPNIIGGSDLIAHHARRNPDMEDWLRQEMEEQNCQTREESLADDLFRYDPRIKRR
ncbi:PREDICTED: nibrin [Thamnophis sirtalis]|uniref:Nibrin n=1 Tax=Thamnophis sirtalis TaxID=35019 RepID=A0A6I9XU50_9SAUR|nr:PREDICTED: nibrin [Thamnophis sirtalis]